MTNLDECKSIETHWTALYENGDNVTYFDSFGVEYIPKEITKIIINTKITANIYRTKGYDSVNCEYFCTGFIDFMLNNESLADFTNSFFPNRFKMNDYIILE